MKIDENIHSEIQLAIKFYSQAYENFERVQEKYGAYLLEKGVSGKKKKKSSLSKNPDFWLPIGDQKTGVIGEYLGKLILSSKYSKTKIEINKDHSGKAWDIEVGKKQYQVKTVSSYSKTEITSPVHPEEIDGLLLIKLNLDMISGFYFLIEDKSEVSKICQSSGKISTKSLWGDKRVCGFKLEELLK